MNCQKTNSRLADLLLDPQSAPVELRRHVEECSSCRKELTELRTTMGVLDEWVVPEPNPFFDTRLMARLRAEQSASRPGFLERLRARFVYGSRLRMQPLMAGALGLVVLIGGGTYADLTWQSMQTQESATVRDLQSLDGNELVFQQLDSVDQGASQREQDPSSMPSND